MKLKDTLNLGKTAFPMRAGLPTKEPVWQKEWEDAKLYQRRQELNQGKPHFTLHDGPPYANGNIHVGHAMNKISKDIIVRSKSMSGFYAPYIPGWDTHGLPIEQVLAKQDIKRKEMDLVEYLKLCREYALSQVDKQREDFKRLRWLIKVISTVVLSQFTGLGHLSRLLLKQRLNTMIWFQLPFTMPTR